MDDSSRRSAARAGSGGRCGPSACVWARLIVGVALSAWINSTSWGAPQAATAPRAEPSPSFASPSAGAAFMSLPPRLAEELATVADFALNFDHAAFYGLVAWTKQRPELLAAPPEAPSMSGEAVPDMPPPTQPLAGAALAAPDWRVLLDRPGDFRGRIVALDGLVGRNKNPFCSERYPELGEIHQLELQRADQPLAISLFCTQSVADIPVGARVRVRGWFLMIRNYPDARGGQRQAAVLITTAPYAVERAAAGTLADAGGLDWRWLLAALLGGAVIVLLLLRNGTGRSRTDPRTLRAAHPAPHSVAEDFQEWVEKEPSHPPGQDRV